MSFLSVMLFVVVVVVGGSVLIAPGAWALIAAVEDHSGRTWVNAVLYVFTLLWVALAIAVVTRTAILDWLRVLARS